MSIVFLLFFFKKKCVGSMTDRTLDITEHFEEQKRRDATHAFHRTPRPHIIKKNFFKKKKKKTCDFHQSPTVKPFV